MKTRILGAVDTRRAALELLLDLLLDIAALIWPTECAGCGAADRDCCQSCLAELRAPPAVLERDLGTACFVAGHYEGPLAALLVAFKHGGRVRFAKPLGDCLRAPLLAGLGECSGPEPPIIVAMPSRPDRVRERGYRHVDLLLARALRRRPSDGGRIAALRLPALRTLRGRRGQVGLGPLERARNASLIAVLGPAESLLRGREAVLVDDVITTGASVTAARQALEGAGARVVAIVALGIAERRDTRGQA